MVCGSLARHLIFLCVAHVVLVLLPDELSPLMLAARVGNVAAIQELLSLGAECNARDAKGRTALFYAIDGAREFSQYERRLLTVLDALGADYGRGASQLLDLDAQDHAGEGWVGGKGLLLLRRQKGTEADWLHVVLSQA